MQQLALEQAIQVVSLGSAGQSLPPLLEEVLLLDEDVETPLLDAADVELEALVDEVLVPPVPPPPPVPPVPMIVALELVVDLPPAPPPKSTSVVPQPPPSTAAVVTLPTAKIPTKVRTIVMSSEGPRRGRKQPLPSKPSAFTRDCPPRPNASRIAA